MSESARGKQMTEEVVFQAFQESFSAITERAMKFISQGESPDFETRVNGVETGVELTEIRKMDDEEEIFAEAYRLAEKKHKTYKSRGFFERRPIILLLYLYSPSLWDIRSELNEFLAPEDYDQLGFSEVWFMDLSDQFYSSGDPRRIADLFCAKPDAWQGFHRFGSHDRKPYG